MNSRNPPPCGDTEASNAETVLFGLRWWLLAIPAAIVYVLGSCGFWVCEGRPETLSGLLDVLYRSLQLFGLEYGDGCDHQTWMLQVARFAAPLVPAGAIVLTLLRTIRAQVREGRLRHLERHVVVCGLGRKGLQLVRDYRREGIPVVAIDLDGSNDNVRICNELGAFVMIGSAIDEFLLRRARVQYADRVVAISGDDGINVEVAMLAHAIIETSKKQSDHRIDAFVHVVDPKLCDLLGKHHVFEDRDDRFRVWVFNEPERIAHALLQKYPLAAGRSAHVDQRDVHLVCVGFGKTGEAVVLEAARTVCAGGGRQLHVTVIDLDAERKAQIFRGRYPGWGAGCTLAFVQGNAADADILERVAGIAGDHRSLATLLVTMKDDSSNLLYALQVREAVSASQLPIFVRMVDVSGLTSLIDVAGHDQGACAGIVPFGMASQFCPDVMLKMEQPERRGGDHGCELPDPRANG